MKDEQAAPRIGRPPKPKALIRKDFIKVYVTSDQKAAFASKAESAGMSGSDFAHRILGPAVWADETTPAWIAAEREALQKRADEGSMGLADYLAALLES